MNQLPSAEFRKQYAALSEVTQVTANGHVIGTWLPGASRAVAQIRNDGSIDVDPWRTELAGKIKSELEKAGVTFSGAAWRAETTTTPAVFVLNIPMAPEVEPVRQSPCPCAPCQRIDPAGCYGLDERRAQADERCTVTKGCECWGGKDRECSGCWIDGK